MAKEKSDSPEPYEEHILQLMFKRKLTLSQALEREFIDNDVDQYSIFDMTEFLADRFGANKDKDMEETQRLWAKVGYYMSVYNGTSNDVELKEHNEKKAKKSSSS